MNIEMKIMKETKSGGERTELTAYKVLEGIMCLCENLWEVVCMLGFVFMCCYLQ